MYYYRLIAACVCFAVGASVPPALAQTPTDPQPTPTIRRWLDVQSVHAATRFRWYEDSAGRVNSSTLQWQSQLRGRFLFDRAGRYHLGALASTGASFTSSWNNTGAGLGTVTHPFNVKQLYLSAEPLKGLELQAGGLFMNRGELGEQITYDNDAYIVGERLTFRPAKGPVTQIAFTAGHFGDLREPNVFKRYDGMNDVNYGQALVGFSLGPLAAASVDYTHENGRDIVREGMNLRMPQGVKGLTLVKVESYQRVDPDREAGFNVSADLRIHKLAVTGGVMSVDRNYGPFNGDRYETGKRYYSIFTYPVTSQLSAQFFHTKAFDIDFPIPLAHRYDIVLTYNPTAALKRAGVF